MLDYIEFNGNIVNIF